MTYYDLLGTAAPEAIYATVGTRRAKQLTKSMGRPFTLRDSVDGPKTMVVFDEHFIERFLQAETDECIAKMSPREKELLWDYMVFHDAGVTALIELNEVDITEEVDAETDRLYRAHREYNIPTKVVKALSEYTAGEVLKIDMNACFNTNHIWNK